MIFIEQKKIFHLSNKEVFDNPQYYDQETEMFIGHLMEEYKTDI